MSFGKKALVFVAAVIVIAAAVPTFAIAQQRFQQVLVVNPPAEPVPVREQGTVNVNVGRDASDREPYQHTEVFNQTDATCEPLGCSVQFTVVPAGKRLVITYASADYALAPGGVAPNVTLSAGSARIFLPLPEATDFGGVLVSGPVTFYVEAGDRPTMRLGGQFVLPVSRTAQAALVGYLVPTT